MKKHKRSGSGQGKAKKSKAGAEYDIDEALSLKRSIESGQLSHQQLLKIVGAHHEPCELYNKSCKGRKDSPNCLCGLIPNPGGFRRKGLWQKEPEAIASLGIDPTEYKRESASMPSGLNNLGNTCYVNAALQGLFMIRGFREGLFAVEEPIADSPIVSHIRRLFAELQEGPKRSADPACFAEALNLDRSIQQDGQEFFKLLLTLLETRLRGSAKKEVRELVQSLFCGTYFYETSCLTCGRLSEGSKRATNFYELEAQVKGASSLEESLARLLSAEHLEGDNRYHCAYCESKVDASRQIRLHSIPPILCLSLQRFVFDMKKLSKVKASDKLSIPLKLDMASILAMAGAQPLQTGIYADAQYELMSILIHKGPSASHGHYVAHVWDADAKKWWRCDDETVTEMPKGPVAERGDHGVAAEKKVGAPATKGKRKSKDASMAMEDPDVIEVTEVAVAAEPAQDMLVNAAAAEEAAASASAPPDRLSSSNAYMLVYRRCDWSSSTGSGPVQLPKSLMSVLEGERKEFEAACKKHEREKQALMEKVQARRATVRGILEAAVLPSAESPARWVPLDWLTQWANAAAGAPVTKGALLCKDHSKLDPGKVTEARRITPAAFEMLQQQVEDCEALEDSDICVQCLTFRMQGFADAHQGSQQREAILEVLDTMDEDAEGVPAEPPGPPDPQNYYVSKTWLQAWRRRQGMTMGDQSPTQSITCPHGSLLPELAGARGRRTAVSPVVWHHLQAAWRHALADRRAKPKKAPKQQKAAPEAAPVPEEGTDERDIQLNEREAAVALREQRVGRMDSELLATFGALPNGNSSFSKEERYQAREAILEMRENAVAAKEEQALATEASHASCAGRSATETAAPPSTAHGHSVQENGIALARPAEAAQGVASVEATCNGHAEQGEPNTEQAAVEALPEANGHAEASEHADTMLEFRVADSEECAICMHEYSQDMSTGQHLREQAGAEKGLLAQLAASSAVHLEPGSTYALLPRPWLAAWRTYIGASGKRGTLSDVRRPQPLPEAVAETFCSCHAFQTEHPEQPVHLNIPPPSIVRRRGRWMQNAEDMDAFELVNQADWQHLMTFYGAESSLPESHPARRPIMAILEVDLPPGGETAKQEEAQPADTEILLNDAGRPINAVPSARGAVDSAKGHLDTQPSLCQQAMSERETAVRAAQLSYTDAPIHVEVVQASDLQKAPAAPPGERRSKRVRRGEAEVKASSSNTLWDFKLRLVEALNIHPRNAEVHIRVGDAWQKLSNDEETLAGLGLGQGQDVKVVHAGLVSDDDFASIVGGPHIAATGSRAVERGFAGTALADIPYAALPQLSSELANGTSLRS